MAKCGSAYDDDEEVPWRQTSGTWTHKPPPQPSTTFPPVFFPLSLLQPYPRHCASHATLDLRAISISKRPTRIPPSPCRASPHLRTCAAPPTCVSSPEPFYNADQPTHNFPVAGATSKPHTYTKPDRQSCSSSSRAEPTVRLVPPVGTMRWIRLVCLLACLLAPA